MPLPRPSLEDIRRRMTSDAVYELGTDAARLEGTVERALIEAGAGASHMLHGRLSWIARQSFVQTADDAEIVRLAAMYGVFRNPAVRSTGKVLVGGSVGTPLPAKTQLVRADGRLYETLANATIVGDFIQVDVRALEGGDAGDCESGTNLTITPPVVGISSATTVATEGITGGSDEETVLELRTRLQERLASPPSGGGPGSYVAWAKEVGGVTRAWEFGSKPTLGSVTVLFMRDNDETPFPNGGEVAAVEAHILEHAPIHLDSLVVQAPTEKALVCEIELEPNGDADLRDAVVAAIQAALAERAAPLAKAGTFYRSVLLTAISTVEGLEDYKLNVPSGDISLATYELLTLDPADVTWV